MRCNPLRWWWGLLPLAVLVWLAVVWEKGPIQEDLRLRTQTALEAAGLNWAGMAFNGRDGLVRGLAFREEHPLRAIEVVRDVWGVRVVDENVDVVDLVANFSWSAARQPGGTIVLNGYVPDEETRVAVMRMAKTRFPKSTIQDDMKLARGGPPHQSLMNGIGFGFDRLSQLSEGQVELTGLRFSASGEALDFSSFKSAKAALRGAMPDGLILAQDDIRPPLVRPYTWAIVRDGGQLTVSGYVPSEALRTAVFEDAKKRFPSLVIVDRMEVGAGPPDDFEAALRATVGQFARLESGEARFQDNDVTVRGRAPDEATARAIPADLAAALARHFSLTHDITFPEPKPAAVSPFVTAIETDEKTVRLTGYAPDDAARESLAEAIRKAFPDKRLVESLEIASGAAPVWRKCLDAGLDAIARLGAGAVRLSDLRLDVTGTTRDEALAETVPAAIRSATTRTCDSQIDIRLDLPREPDLLWRAIYDGGKSLVLSGEVPDSETMAVLVSAARKQYPNAEIDNRMTVGEGYASRWQKVALTGLGLLKLLRSGEARLSGQDLVVTGIAPDTAAETSVRERLVHNLPKSYSGLARLEVKSDAMLWAEIEAKRKAEEAETQRRKEQEQRRKAEEEAREKERQERESKPEGIERLRNVEPPRTPVDIVERTPEAEPITTRRTANALPPPSQAGTSPAPRTLAADSSGPNLSARSTSGNTSAEATSRRASPERPVIVRDMASGGDAPSLTEAAPQRRQHPALPTSNITITAVPADEEPETPGGSALATGTVEAPSRKPPGRTGAPPSPDRRSSKTVTARAAPAPPEALDCQMRMTRAALRGTILFETAKAKLDRTSHRTLDRIASIARGCPDVRLNVEGHTDSVGSDEDNQRLSERRSQAVIDYLTKRGVPAGRLRAIGHGEAQPLLPNDSPANRSRNRRIEFSVNTTS